MRRIAKSALLGTLAVGLVLPLAPSAAVAEPTALCIAPLGLGTGWTETCGGAGSGVLTLTISSGRGFASVVCTGGGNATLNEPGPGTYTTGYGAAGTCEMVAGGTGTGSASA
jgi:hypothetical protein